MVIFSTRPSTTISFTVIQIWPLLLTFCCISFNWLVTGKLGFVGVTENGGLSLVPLLHQLPSLYCLISINGR